jgi:uncharacterized glyoxalase superfamily protein PhnB
MDLKVASKRNPNRKDETMAYCEAVTPCFAVANIEETMAWYEQHFAFSADPFPAKSPFVFCILRRDEVEIMLQRVEGYAKSNLYQLRPGGVWDAYIRVTEVKDIYEAVRDKVEVIQPLHRQLYGQTEFEVKDPNGYVLVFSEET